jgi:hypothetical protein
MPINGLEPDRDAATEAERHSALQSPEPGKIVFVYCKTPAAAAVAGSEHRAFHTLAA